MEGHGAAPPPPAAHQSPSQTHAYTSYSPADPHARHRSGSYNGVPPSPNIYHRSVPASPTVARQPLPAQSPSTTRDRPTSSYYDPTSEARASVNHPSYHPRSPISGRAHYDSTQPPVAYANGHNTDTRTAYSRHSSQASPPLPYASIHAHPPTAPLDARSPTSYREPARSNGTHSHTASLDSSAPAPAPARSTNPMSMMNLLSDNAAPPSPAPKPSILKESSPVPAPAPAPVIAPAPAPMPVPGPVAAPVTARAVPPPSPPPVPVAPKSRKGGRISAARSKEAAAESRRASAVIGDEADTHSSSPRGASAKDTPASAAALINLVHTGPPGLSEEGTEAAFIEIENADLSDVEAESDFFRRAKTEWLESRKKRGLEIELQEDMRRKRRKMLTMQTQHDHFFNAAESEKTIYVDKHEQEVAEEVRLREIEEDKERKKDQQRKRRREKAIADEQIKQEETLQKLASAKDDDERMRLEKEVQRHAKKIRDTQNRLQGIVPSKEPRTESPHNAAALGRREREVNLDGGLMTSFFTGSQKDGEDAGTPEHTPSGRGRGRGGRGGAGAGTGRARKSKEQKLAEKENARLAQSFIDQGQDLPSIAPKEEERLASYSDRRRDDSEPLSDAGPTSFDVQPTAGLTGMARFESKGYNQVYEQITREVAKVCIPKAIRIKNSSLDTKQSNARKTAQLASKEAKRWQQRTNKSTKDVAARAKRAMREMLGFWKRNERDEREGRKVAEKHELEKARRAEADREANRQKRKLNFLISQTELYSHFIGKKVKTDEIERSGNGDIVASNQTTTDDPNATHTVNLPDSVANLNKKVTNFEDLDFDAEDETALQEAAMANAQNAIKEAQDRAREFNKPSGENDLGDAQANMDEGELNFQNPTSLQSMDVEQPKMLTCKLKEYQLKGLNWLVNLYEQGINGILADEMGLGKTVQSISVMAYLAEVHDIWGPFLVIAPASTLHNWQQEITKFVPTIKVLPYWGSAKDRKVLRKFWDRKHITYNRDSPFHVLVTSYQLVVQDTAYFQKVKWQYMILDEAQAIKSSSSSRWKSLLGFHCRNRLLLTGTPIQNNMQELWALLHFIMPSLFDSHDEFSEWFSKDIENHAQSNSKLNEDQLRRLHMILKPFMLRRIKKHVQKELGDKIELDVFCDLTYRQRAYYTNLRNKISIMDLIEKAAVGDDQDTATLMNLVMQFRKVCNHPDLFERAEIKSPLSMSYYAETASFMREGTNVNVSYSVRNLIEYWMPKMLAEDPGRLNVAGPKNSRAGWRKRWLQNDFSIWDSENVYRSSRENGAFSWLRFVDDQTANDTTRAARDSLVDRVVTLAKTENRLGKFKVAYDDEDEKENANFTPLRNMLNIVGRNDRKPLAEASSEGHLNRLFNISREAMDQKGYSVIETCYLPAASAPPIELVTPSEQALVKRDASLFNVPARRALYPITTSTELALLQSKLPPTKYPVTNLLPAADQVKQRYTKIEVPSMRRFVTDSGKLARLDQLLRELKEGGHRVLLYFQMTRMIDLMEEYLTYRNYKYCRLDGSTKLEDRRDTVAAFQSSPEIFVFLLSTRAGGLGINLVAADTVIFYDSDWNPTIDSQAMDRAHRLGQTRQVTVYRLITRGTIEERIRKRALQKEEVQRVVISGQTGGGNIDFNNRSHRENNRTKEMAMWLADDEQAAEIERREAEVLDEEAKAAATGKPKKRKSTAAGGRKGGKEVSMDDMYHEGEGKFDDGSHEPSGAATPIGDGEGPPMKKRKGISKKAKTISQRLAVIDGQVG